MTKLDKHVTIVIAGLLALAIAGIFFVGSHLIQTEGFKLEVTKSLLQLVVVVVFGGIVSALIKQRESSIQLAQARAEVYEKYISRLGKVYRDVKKIRRVLQAGGLSSIGRKAEFQISEIQQRVYRQEMERLNDAQLELEGLKIESKHLPILASEPTIHANLESMEKYLRKILKEYEKISPSLDGGARVEFSRLVRLEEFTGHTEKPSSLQAELAEPEEVDETSRYRLLNELWDPYDDVVKKLAELNGSIR